MSNYIKPTTTIVAVKTLQMIAGSLDPENNKGTVFDEFAPVNGDGEAKGISYGNGNIWED